MLRFAVQRPRVSSVATAAALCLCRRTASSASSAAIVAAQASAASTTPTVLRAKRKGKGKGGAKASKTEHQAMKPLPLPLPSGQMEAAAQNKRKLQQKKGTSKRKAKLEAAEAAPKQSKEAQGVKIAESSAEPARAASGGIIGELSSPWASMMADMAVPSDSSSSPPSFRDTWGPDKLVPTSASGLREQIIRDVPPHFSRPAYDPAAPVPGLRSATPAWAMERPTLLMSGERAESARLVRARDEVLTGAAVREESGNDKGYLSKEKLRQRRDCEQSKWKESVGGKMNALQRDVKKVEPLREMEVPQLAHGLTRVLFNPGVHWLREPRTGIYNYDPALRTVADVDLFDYDTLTPYVTSSLDPELSEITRREGARYCGSTSSLTGALSQIYFHLSRWKSPDLRNFSEGFAKQSKGFGFGAKLPTSIKLRKLNAAGEPVRYAVDADKEATGDSENSNYVLAQLGKSMEKLLTCSTEEYTRHLRVNSHLLTPEERSRKESYHYARAQSLVMRSQLDCTDPRLPRQTFDLKTRACAAVRQDRANWVESGGYLIRNMHGQTESFEKERYDMIRSAWLKYYFQARIGHMDGIFVAYHSTANVHGFQYYPLEEMGTQVFGSVDQAEQSFKLCVALLEEILDAATLLWQDQSLKLTFNTNETEDVMDVFVEPDEGDAEKEAAKPASSKPGKRSIMQFEVKLDRYLDGFFVRGPVDFKAVPGRAINEGTEDEITRRKREELGPVQWNLEYAITPLSHLTEEQMRANLQEVRVKQATFSSMMLPNVEALNAREEERLEALAQNPAALARFRELQRSGQIGMPLAPGQKGDAELAAATAEQEWKKGSKSVMRLRELARLGAKDTEAARLVDKLEMYE